MGLWELGEEKKNLGGLNSSLKMKVRMEQEAWSQAWVLHSGAGRCCVPFNVKMQQGQGGCWVMWWKQQAAAEVEMQQLSKPT